MQGTLKSTMNYKISTISIDLFVIFSIIVFSGGIQTFLVPVSTHYDVSTGNLFYQILSAFIAIISLILLRLSNNTTLIVSPNNVLPIILLLLVMLSFFWSHSPAITLRRSIALIGNSIFVFFMVSRYNLQEFIKIISYSLITVAIVTLLTVIIYPEMGIHLDKESYIGAWRGAFQHKNRMGQYMVLGAISYFFYSLDNSPNREIRYKLKSYFILIFFVFLIFKAQSTTSIIALIIISMFIFFIYTVNVLYTKEKIVPLIGLGFSIICISVVFLLVNIERFLDFFGKNLTFTGRTFIWTTALTFGSENKFFGAGFKGFWPVHGKSYSFSKVVDHGHNAFLDVWLDLGFAGLLITLIMLVIMIQRSMVCYNKKLMSTSFPLVLSVYIMLFSITGVRFIDQNSLNYILFLANFLYCTSNKSPLAAVPATT